MSHFGSKTVFLNENTDKQIHQSTQYYRPQPINQLSRAEVDSDCLQEDKIFQIIFWTTSKLSFLWLQLFFGGRKYKKRKKKTKIDRGF